uniref:TNF superfamily member 9 n=1 Tax=Marmota marmota marmota TaxID=9994 RepID=A0A8C6EX12_MARMA
MSSSSDAAADPEAQWPPAKPAQPARTCRPQPALVAALAILTMRAACASSCPSPGTATSRAFTEVPELPPNVPANLWDPLPKVRRAATRVPGTLSWYSQQGLKGVYLSPGLNYSEDTRELVVAEDGVYYVFLQLELQRKATLQNGGEVSLTLLLQPPPGGAAALALTVHLPCSSEPRNSAGGFRGDLLHLSAGQRLSVRLSVHLHQQAHAQDAWQLAQGGTALGLFRVTTKVPDGFF